GDQQRLVIGGRLAVREAGEGRQNLLNQAVSREGGVFEHFIEPLEAKKPTRPGDRLRDAIRVEDDLIARDQRLHLLFVPVAGEHAKRKTAHAIERGYGAIHAALEARWVVPRARIGELTLRRVVDPIERGHEGFVLGRVTTCQTIVYVLEHRA